MTSPSITEEPRAAAADCSTHEAGGWLHDKPKYYCEGAKGGAAAGAAAVPGACCSRRGGRCRVLAVVGSTAHEAGRRRDLCQLAAVPGYPRGGLR